MEELINRYRIKLDPWRPDDEEKPESNYSPPLTISVSHALLFESICMIMDLEGFFVRKKFLVREIGYVDEETGGFYCDLSSYKSNLDWKDRRSALYSTRNVHGVGFLLEEGENALPPDSVGDVVASFHKKFRESGFGSVVAYKGGHVERDLLRKLGIPNPNLGTFGSHKFVNLITTYPLPNLDIKCGLHRKFMTGQTAHCPQWECHAFRHCRLHLL